MTKEYVSGSFMFMGFVCKKLRGVKNMKMELKTRKTNFHKIGAQFRILETVGPSPFLVNSMALDILPTTVDLKVNSVEERLQGTEIAFWDLFIYLFPFSFLKHNTPLLLIFSFC